MEKPGPRQPEERDAHYSRERSLICNYEGMQCGGCNLCFEEPPESTICPNPDCKLEWEAAVVTGGAPDIAAKGMGLPVVDTLRQMYQESQESSDRPGVNYFTVGDVTIRTTKSGVDRVSPNRKYL
jgi:hypothetical protein